MNERSSALPRARTRQLLCRELPDGLMAYDSERHQAHTLNPAAALIWQHCDGKRTASELARVLHAELGLPMDEEIVRLALSRLDKARLLEGSPPPSPEVAAPSRRAVLRKLGLSGGLALLLPVVTSLAAPQAAEAESMSIMSMCIKIGQPCQTSSQCCMGAQGRRCVPKVAGGPTLCC